MEDVEYALVSLSGKIKGSLTQTSVSEKLQPVAFSAVIV